MSNGRARVVSVRFFTLSRRRHDHLRRLLPRSENQRADRNAAMGLDANSTATQRGKGSIGKRSACLSPTDRTLGQKEEVRRRAAHLHEAEDAPLVYAAKMVDDGLPVVDHRGARASAELDTGKPRGRPGSAQDPPKNPEYCAGRGALCKARPAQCDADGHHSRVERDAGLEDQRIDVIDTGEALAAPAKMLKQAVERMSRRQSEPAPLAEHF